MLTEVPKSGRFVAVVFSERGTTAFSLLEGVKAGERQVYYIDAVRQGRISGAQMLLGQFVTEFEQEPQVALSLTPGSTNRLYFPGSNNNEGLQGDNRVIEYDDLTSEEVEDTRARLAALAATHPKAADLLCHL